MNTTAPPMLTGTQLSAKDRASVIKYGLALNGYTQADIAREFKTERGSINRSTVNMVINGRGRSRKIENRIAAILQMTPADLWPQWHSAKPARRRRISPAQMSEALRALAG